MKQLPIFPTTIIALISISLMLGLNLRPIIDSMTEPSNEIIEQIEEEQEVESLLQVSDKPPLKEVYGFDEDVPFMGASIQFSEYMSAWQDSYDNKTVIEVPVTWNNPTDNPIKVNIDVFHPNGEKHQWSESEFYYSFYRLSPRSTSLDYQDYLTFKFSETGYYTIKFKYDSIWDELSWGEVTVKLHVTDPEL